MRHSVAAAGEPLKHQEYSKVEQHLQFVNELDSSCRDFKVNAGIWEKGLYTKHKTQIGRWKRWKPELI